MASSFDVSHAPFDRLTPSEAELARAALDIGYFSPGETIIARGGAAESLFVIIKGQVEERDGADAVSLRGPADCFDSRALVQGGGSLAFVAREETLCHLLPREMALKLINRNPRFAAFFYSDISRKLEAAADAADEARASPMVRARVSDLRLQTAAVVGSDMSIDDAAKIMKEAGVRALMVRDADRTGIVTKSDLADAVIVNKQSVSARIGTIAQYSLICVGVDEFVSVALMRMTKHNKRRLVAKREDEIAGILEDIDLLSFLAGNARMVATRIERAQTVSDLAKAAEDIQAQIRLLRRQGVKIEVVAEIVSDLNRQLLARLFRILAPRSIGRRGCLIVMGSEGRGEQTVRTDQDNGLILSEAVPQQDLDAFRVEFTAALERFGFPPCPGDVMVRNPLWSKPIEDYRADFRRWLALRDEEAFMNIAIFYDAEAVAGDADLLSMLKSEFSDMISGEPVMLAHFARAADQFPSPIGLFNNLVTDRQQGDTLDLKKGGIFPIVHGIRSLAIERKLTVTSTTARIEQLAELGVLKREMAKELIDTFRYLMTLRLDAQLALVDSDKLLKPAELTTMERDLLRDALRVVKTFRDHLRRHFNLSVF